MGKTEIPKAPKGSLNAENIFSLKFFNMRSIKTKEYNSFYKDKDAAVKGIIGFFWILDYISKNSLEKLDFREKKRLHFCKYDPREKNGKEAIRRVRDVLVGYGLTKERIDEYEDEYYEITAKGDGARLIFIKYDGKVCCPLFIDANHMICNDLRKNPKMKMTFSVPSILEEKNISYSMPKEKMELFEDIDTIVECYKDGSIETKEEFLKEYEAVFQDKNTSNI